MAKFTPLEGLPKVAVCLATHNGTRWLAEQLDSIYAQIGVAITVFVSVDASTDGTEDLVNACAQEDSRIVVLPHGEHFGGAARNFFRILRDVDFSNFDYISFADQDDIWLPNKLQRANEVMTATGADAYSSNVTAFWPDGRKMLINKAQPQTQWDFLFEAAGPGCTYVLTKELGQDIQATVKSHWDDMQLIGLHDWFFYAYARAHAYRWVIDDVPGLLYRQHAHNQVGVNAGLPAFKVRARKIISGWGLSQSLMIARLVGVQESSFVKRWASGSRLGMLYLAFHAPRCRRRLRDQIFFSLICLLLYLTGKQPD